RAGPAQQPGEQQPDRARADHDDPRVVVLRHGQPRRPAARSSANRLAWFSVAVLLVDSAVCTYALASSTVASGPRTRAMLAVLMVTVCWEEASTPRSSSAKVQ